MPSPPAGEIPDVQKLQAPLARLLRPLVRLLIRSGMTFPMIADLLRELYVHVAEHDFALPGKEQTDSRVSLLTGIHRKEVSRLRGAGTPVSTVPVTVSRTSRILARWQADPSYCDASGKPLPLPRVAEHGPSFESLVESVTRDVRPRAILDEWIDRKLVDVADDTVVLVEAAALPPGGDDQKLYYFGRNMHDHMAASVTNILGAKPRFFERAVHYDGLSAGAATALETRARALAMTVLTDANRDAHTTCEQDHGGTWRWNFGIYLFAESETEGPADEAEVPTAGPRR